MRLTSLVFPFQGRATLIEFLNAKLDTKFSEQNAKLDAKFSDQKAELDAKFSDQDAKLDTKFREQNAKLDTKFSDQKAELDAKFSDQDAKLDAKFSNQDAKLDAKFSQQRIELEAKFRTELDAMFSQQNSTMDAKFKTVLQAQGLFSNVQGDLVEILLSGYLERKLGERSGRRTVLNSARSLAAVLLSGPQRSEADLDAAVAALLDWLAEEVRSWRRHAGVRTRACARVVPSLFHDHTRDHSIWVQFDYMLTAVLEPLFEWTCATQPCLLAGPRLPGGTGRGDTAADRPAHRGRAGAGGGLAGSGAYGRLGLPACCPAAMCQWAYVSGCSMHA